MIQQFSRLAVSTQDLIFSQISDSELPHELANTPPIRKIDSMFLINFKSFGKKYIGPFLNFTSIIGPNGSGKSNILDAMMFCFCSQTSKNSLLDPRQLINRQGKQNFKDLIRQQKICSVSICFILEDGQKFTIQRILDPEGNQQYRINHGLISKKLYQNVLLRKGINCNTPNYAIWQGQIDRLVLKEPMQMTTLFENLSGSIYCKKQYDEIKEKLDSLHQEYESKIKIINKLKLEKKNMKTVKKNTDNIEKLESAYSHVMEKFYMLSVMEKESEIQEQHQEVQRKAKEEESIIKEINERKAIYQKSHQQKQALQKQLNQHISNMSSLYSSIKKIDNPVNVLYIQEANQTSHEIQILQNQLKEVQKKRSQLMQSIPEIPSSQLIDEYLKIYEKWEQENSALNRQYVRRNNQLLFVEGMLQNKKELFSEFESNKRKFHQKQDQQKIMLNEYRKNLEQIKSSIKSLEKDKQKHLVDQHKHQNEITHKQNVLAELEIQIEDLQLLISEETSNKQQAELLKHLSSISHFYGVLQDKIKPVNSKFETVFEILFTNISKNLLVQTQKSSRQIGDRLRQMNLMKTLVILDNVILNTGTSDKNKNSTNSEIRRKLGRDGQLAIDCIEYDERMTGLKQYLNQFLFGKIVCDNIGMAYRIRDKKIEGVREIYTVDGNIVRLNGTISSHGNPEALKKAYKYHINKSNVFQDLAKLSKEKSKLESEIKNHKLKYTDNGQYSSQLSKLEIKRHETQEQIKAIEKNQERKEPKISQSLLSEIEQLEKKKEKIHKGLGELDRMIRSSKLFEDFMRENNIENLDAFRNANNFQHVEKVLKKKREINREISNLTTEQNSLRKELLQKQRKQEKLKKAIESMPHKKDKIQLEKDIVEGERQIEKIRSKISKLSISTDKDILRFQSALPSLQAKLQYAKQKITKQLEQLAEEYGVRYQYPIDDEDLRKELSLPKKRKITESDYERIHEQLTNEKNKIQENLNRYNTLTFMKLRNNKETEDEIQKRIDNLTEELDHLREHRAQQTQELEKIRKDRSLILINFINVLKKNLDVSYKILTELENGLAGNIDLHIENSDYPFDYGVYFSPTPPTKRFVYDLQQLSGGEKSIASLALQYSLALATGVPFLILDETDAFLDANNLSRFLKLIQHSLEKKNVQMVVVSHKQALFSQSESLLGVSRPKSNPLSQVFSLKLTEG